MFWRWHEDGSDNLIMRLGGTIVFRRMVAWLVFDIIGGLLLPPPPGKSIGRSHDRTSAKRKVIGTVLFLISVICPLAWRSLSWCPQARKRSNGTFDRCLSVRVA